MLQNIAPDDMKFQNEHKMKSYVSTAISSECLRNFT